MPLGFAVAVEFDRIDFAVALEQPADIRLVGGGGQSDATTGPSGE
jgi:hypothetical protein